MSANGEVFCYTATKSKRSHLLFEACWIQNGVDFSLFDVQQEASCNYEGRECSQTSSP